MKKLIATGAALVMVCAVFTGCGSDNNEYSGAVTGNVTERATEKVTKDNDKNKVTDRIEDEDTTFEETGSNHSAGDYVSDVIDGVESAGEDLVEGVGDAAGDIVNGFDGNNNDNR